MEELRKLQYPIGEFHWDGRWDEELKQRWIQGIEVLPSKIQAILAALTPSQRKTPYRPGGWNAVQVIHHLADSHMNSYIRFKLALTEDVPVIKPYLEDKWAVLPDTAAYTAEGSIRLLVELHARWVTLLRSLTEEDYARTFYHPERGAAVSLKEALAMYDWHGRHHTAHLALIR